MFAGLPPSSSDLTERKSVVPPSPPADRRREHRDPPTSSSLAEGKRLRSLLLSTAARDFPTLAIGSARLAAMFAGLPHSSSDLPERKALFRHLLLHTARRLG